ISIQSTRQRVVATLRAMGSTGEPSRSKQDRNVYLPQDFDCNTEARCSTCDKLVNVHKWMEHKNACFITKNERCDLCTADFNHEVNLTIHKMLKHAKNSKNAQECTICNKNFQRDSAFRGHVLSHSLGEFLICHCNEEFDSAVELTRHKRMRHTENGTMSEALICCYCGEIFSPHDLDTHKRTHTYERVLQKNIDSARKRMEKKCSNPVVRPHICPVCEKAFRRPKELERHEAIHSEKRDFKCAFCLMEFRHQNVLNSHEKLHKKANKIFKCRICHHQFNSKFNLHRHLQMTHMRRDNELARKRGAVEEEDQLINLINDQPLINHQVAQYAVDELVHCIDGADAEDNTEETNGDEWNESQFENQDSNIEQDSTRWDLDGVTGCDLAEQLFHSRENQKERIVIVPENSLRCPACLHSMESLDQVMTHFQTLAEKDPLHRRATLKCIFCHEEVGGIEVYSHLHSHGIYPNTQNVPLMRSLPRPHSCPSCLRSFTKKIDLTRHMRRHTGEKPFTCRICGDKFRVETTLRRHEKIHLDMDATHECSLCGKRFWSRNSLRTHIISHSVPCSHCNQTFKSAVERDEHAMKEHSNREIGMRYRVGGLILPCLPGGLATLSEISRPCASTRLPPTSLSAFHSIPSSSNEERPCIQFDVNVDAEDTTKDGMLMKISRKRMGQESAASSDQCHQRSLSFSVPHHLLSSLQVEGGVLRTQLNRGRVINMHPSETLSALNSTERMDLHPGESQSSHLTSCSIKVRSSSFVPIDLNSDNYFIDHCNICDLSFSTKEESEAHMSSEDHETAMLLSPHSGLESANTQMVCKLCGNRFVSMAPLVEHIRREHERDHPKSLAPLNLHTSHLISTNTH
ncbi:hypothetical protein PMAYCL1PPCAC_23839, partial [Pristionchus mayeri]